MKQPARKFVIGFALTQAWDDLLSCAKGIRRGDVYAAERLRGYATLIEAIEWWKTSEYPRVGLDGKTRR